MTGYIGFDCTADSLHVGNLVDIMMLRWLQQTGHRPIALIGGGTSKVGDPSGKDESRQMLDDDDVAANIAGDPALAGELPELRRRSRRRAPGRQRRLAATRSSYIQFLREVGRHFTVNRMLTFDSVKLRLEREQPLTFLEFNYMVMQAYDFLELARRYGCRLQMGGSDQWGNIVNGVDLGRRAEGRELYGLTTPLITTASGAKMGKTAAGAVWLNAERLPAFDYWQFWRNVDDADVGRFLRLFTELPLAEIERLERLQGAELNEAKKALAYAATSSAGGEVAAVAAAETARGLFEKNCRLGRCADLGSRRPRRARAGRQHRRTVRAQQAGREQWRGTAVDPGRRRGLERGKVEDEAMVVSRGTGRRRPVAVRRQEAPRLDSRRRATKARSVARVRHHGRLERALADAAEQLAQETGREHRTD